MNDTFSHAAWLHAKFSGKDQDLTSSFIDCSANEPESVSEILDLKKEPKSKVETIKSDEFSVEPPKTSVTNDTTTQGVAPVIVKRLPNGAVLTEDPNNIQPYRVLTWPDGTRLIEHYLDGINVLEQPDGSRTTTFADGSVIRTFPSGKKLISRK